MKERVIYVDAREDGRRDGLEEGLKEGLKISELNVAKMLVKSVDAVMQNFHVDLSAACQGSGHSIEEYHKAKELIDNREKPETI